MRWHFLAHFVFILLRNLPTRRVFATERTVGEVEVLNLGGHRKLPDARNISPSGTTSPMVIPNAIHNATATILHTSPIEDIPAKAWIRFDGGPLVEIEDDLSLESIEKAHNKTVGKNDHSSTLPEPFSFESPFANPVCVFNGTIVEANVTGPSNLLCQSPAIDNTKGAGVPLRISYNGGHDVSTSEIFVYLSSQQREPLLLDPNHGPSLGGTRVFIRGITSGTIVDGPYVLCKFGKHISHAIEVGMNGEHVICSSPPWSANDNASSVAVDVSMAGQINVFSGVEVVFRYDEEFSISSLHPASGLVIGGNQVTIHGGPFQNPDEIVCRFGEKVVDALYHDVGEISCISPNLGWIDEVQRVSLFTMAANPEIQTVSANVDDFVNEVHTCHTFGETDLADDELGRGFRLVAPGGSIEYPLSRHTRWLHFNETADGMKDALTGLFPDGFHVNRTGPLQSQTYRWDITLPKNETFDGETLHVVNSGGGAVKLRGTNASVSCVLALKGTKRLDGNFKLIFSNNGSYESSRPIAHNATNEEIKAALEELRDIGRVEVNSASLDSNLTGSGAFQWHLTFDSLKNAGDVPLLTTDYSSPNATLLGSSAAIEISETRKGTSHPVFKIQIPSEATNFNIIYNGIEGRTLPVGDAAAEVVEVIKAIGGESIVVEKYGAEYYFLDITGHHLNGTLKAKFFQCGEGDAPPSCPGVVQSSTLHATGATSQLAGYFSLEYPADAVACKTCRHSTGLIPSLARAHELESALEQLDLVDKVEVVITESERFEEYKIPVQSGIVGLNRNFYIHFVQSKFSSSNLLDKPVHSTSFSGDVPLLIVNETNLRGTPTRDAAYSNEYNAKVIEVVKGTDLNHGGSVEVAVSINGGVDFSGQNPLFEYKPVPIVQNITPSYGSITGGTSIRVVGHNFSKKSARFCLFWGIGAFLADGIKSGMIEFVPISKYKFADVGEGNNASRLKDTAIAEVTCVNPASLTPQFVHVAVVSNEDVSALEGSLHARGEFFHYHQEIKISSIRPGASPVDGNTTVDVLGGPFFSSEGLSCMFGELLVPGTFHSPRRVSCTTPPHESGTYSVEVTPNGQDFTNVGHVFRFYHACNVYSISPTSGPAERAGTNVQVYGENFVNTTSLRCKLGSVIVPATFVHSSEIHCSSPPMEIDALQYMQKIGYYPQLMRGRLVSFEVTNNGQDFTSNGHEFLYLEDIEASHFSRREGPSCGGTPVFISGSNFVNNTQLKCRFGRETTPAHFLTRYAVLCLSPPIFGQNYLNTIKRKAFPLAVSTNAADYVFFGDFTYTSSTPKGTYQAGTEGNNTLLVCPRGAYCSGLAENNFTLCNPGTYQPIVGQSSCTRCPVGYVCNDFSMSVPRICPAHYVCDEKGMGVAKPCPTNYICDRGTASLSMSCLKSFDFGSETCFDNSTDDFGLQASSYPAQMWAERHLVPLDEDASTKPIRGRFCLDNSCISFENDSYNFQVFDESFDYTSTGFDLRRPKCSEGTNCDPEISPTSQACSKGHYCRLGIKRPCMAGAYCPHDRVFDPLPCEPGTFNFMIGQDKCSECPLGYFCPRYGLSDPVICSPGFVCSKEGLTSPNIRCPAGFYCLNGTKTSDPFRNDTTLRPYACTPGTFCFAGTGSNEDAQPCAAGFFCEAASTSAKGSGACPPSFQCPKGTANPRPTPRGFYAEHPGTIESTACLPGFYAPTIQTAQCYECPPGTSCMFEGLFEASECGPGTYRSTSDENGHGCVPCPQGTWSKNWGLREKGECVRCPTGVVCPLEGLSIPCSYTDLPTAFEPIVRDFRGMPAYEFTFPIDSKPPAFSMDECLALNSDEAKSSNPSYFFGELIPPYIDILGRGPHFRASDQASLRYSTMAKCYKNSQPQGSHVYMRMADYYGPQYDIQTDHPHQGYGIALLNNQIFAVSPPDGYDFSFEYFRGEGNGYISLPKARVYDPAFNCTKGMMLMNSSLVMEDVKQIVYTDPVHDFEGGYDVEKCPTFDSELDCYIDETYEMHAKGDCCIIDKFEQRAIFLAHDQFYRGTCEADLICSEGGMAPPQAKSCDDGFVCDEGTSLENSTNYRCPAGFVCEFATTPDTKLHAPGSQLKRLCEQGHFCVSDDLGQPSHGLCPHNHWCPTGTSDPSIGLLASDGLLRMLDDTRTTPLSNLQHKGGDTFSLLSDHDTECNAATFSSLQNRFQAQIVDHSNINNLEYFVDEIKWPIATNEATSLKEQCARDNKSSFIQDAMRRKECNCHSQFLTLASVYRIWKCTSDEPLDDLGLGDAIVPPSGRGMRDFWYPHSRIHKDFESAVATDPSMEDFGLQFGEGNTCKFLDSDAALTLSQGRLPDEDELPDISHLARHSSGYLDLRGNDGFLVRFTSAETRLFQSYSELKEHVKVEYLKEREQAANGRRSVIDPIIFDLYNSLQLIEQFGQRLEQLVYLNATNETSSTSIELDFVQGNDTYSQEFDFVLPLDWCECQNLLRCPNATTSGEGSTNLADCLSTKKEVLHRISLLPPVNKSAAQPPLTVEGTIDMSPTLHLEPFDVALLTVDQSRLPNNLTYGDHYRISIYDGCKPCPLRYQCEKAGEDDEAQSLSCDYPPIAKQLDILNQCLKQHRKRVCLRADGLHQDIKTCEEEDDNDSFLIFSEPDLDKCLARPYFCSDTSWNFLSFRRLCQDMNDGNLSPIYDCSNVQRWQIYSRWRDEICCSDVQELRGVNSCQDNSVCVDDPLIEEIIREKLIGVFELEHGFIPPMGESKGQLLMNSSLQEELDHGYPFDLFNEWQQPFYEDSKTQKKTPHNKYKPASSKIWKETTGCCKCHHHSMPSFFEINSHVSGFPDDKHQSVQLAISALARVELTVVVELLHGAHYSDFRDYFSPVDKTILRVHSPRRFTEDHDQATWLAVIEKSNFDKLNLDLPLNLPTRIAQHGTIDIESRFLVDRPSNISIGDLRLAANVFEEAKEYGDGRGPSSPHPTSDPIESVRENDAWWPHDFLALPYIPFFSNCDGYDSHINLSRLLEEHPDCRAVSYSQTVPTKEYNGKDPASDTCLGAVLRCTYEEEVMEARKKLRWFELSPGSTLFQITKDAVKPNQFLPSSAEEEWGRTDSLDSMRNYDLIPITVDKELGGHRHTIPRKVELELKYFQRTKGTKRLVEARLYFHELCTTQQPEHFGGSTKILDMMQERGIFPCRVDINGNTKSRGYDLEIMYYPLGWFDLLNRFEFGGSVYFVFYTLMGLAISSIGGFVYGMNRLLTKLRHPPKFMGASLIKLLSWPQIEGATLAVIPYMSTLLIIYSMFSDATFKFFDVHRDWSKGGKVGYEEQIENAMGRLGSAFIVLGFFTVYRSTQKLIPAAQANKVDATNANVGGLSAKRAHFIWIGISIEALLMCLWEFSYSDVFRNNIYRFKVMFQLCQMILDVVISHIMRDRLLAAPLLVSIQMAELLVTIGAHSFVEFTMSFLVEISLSVLLRLFLYPLIKKVLTLWPRWKLMARQHFGGKGLTRQEKQEQELRWKKVNEDIELRTEGIEPLLDSLSVYSVEKTGSIMLPFMFLLLMLLYTEAEMATSYNINQHELLYYVVFTLYMLPWTSLVDLFILSSQELLYGWRVYDYLSFSRWRFTNRESRWNLLANVDESVAGSLQNVDLLCFSSQHYFILSIIALGFGTNMIGITICLRRKYNFLGDPVFPLIVAVVISTAELMSQFFFYISSTSIDAISWGGIWKVTQLQGTMDDVVAAKLAIGEGRQEDLERERQELQALNNDTFRHKFIDKNRPWVLQHLVELMTPRSLQDVGPDGRPVVDYVREVYSKLMNVGEGVNRRADDRSDISSDDYSDDEEEKRRQWDRMPLEGSQLLIAQIWIQKARKRRVFTQAVAAIIEKRKEDHCLSCSRTLDGCSSLTAGLAWNGRYDPYAIDSLIKLFEDSYSPGESNPNLWKAFFRENARFWTICKHCLDQLEQNKLHKDVRHVGAGIPTRPGDISSDESDDGEPFEPVIVVRSSEEGRMMSKWLDAAREKMGGKFPRKSAVKQTERYLEKLTHSKPATDAIADRKSDNAETNQGWGKVELTEKDEFVIKRWLNAARKSERARFDSQAEVIRSQLRTMIESLDVEDDWATGELRLEGKALKIEGDQIVRQKEIADSRMSKQLEALRSNFELIVSEIDTRRREKKEELEKSLSHRQTLSQKKKESRKLELNKKISDLQESYSIQDNADIKEQYEKEIADFNSLVKTEMEAEDKRLQSQANDLVSQFKDQSKLLDRDLHSSLQVYERDCQILQEKIRKGYVRGESDWQKKVNMWLGWVNRKVEAHEREGLKNLKSAKKARLEERRTKKAFNQPDTE